MKAVLDDLRFDNSSPSWHCNLNDLEDVDSLRMLDLVIQGLEKKTFVAAYIVGFEATDRTSVTRLYFRCSVKR